MKAQNIGAKMSINDAEQFEENEQYEQAYEEYKRSYAQKPKSIDILERLGHVAMILDKKDEATEYFKKILEIDATSVMAYEQLMDIYFQTDRYKYYVSRGNLHVVQQEISHAISDFKKALDKTHEENEINSTRFVLASLYEQIGKPHQAIDEYLRILDTNATNEFVFLKLAQIYVGEDSLSSAIDTLERARERGFDTETIKENLAKLYLRSNQPELARSLTKDKLVEAKSLLEEEKNQAAFEILEKIKNDYKKNAQYHSLLAQYYFNVKDWEKSLESVTEFDKFEKNSPLTYQMRALIYEEQGNEFDSHINWAKYNLSRKDKDVALNEYFLAYQVKEDDANLIQNIAELLEDTGDRMHASEFWEKLVKLEPRNKKALEKFANFKESIGDYRAEAEILEKLYAFDSRNAEVAKKLGVVYEKIKNKDKALDFYNKFLSLSAVSAEYEQIKQKVAKLENTEMEEDEGIIGKLMKMFSR